MRQDYDGWYKIAQRGVIKSHRSEFHCSRLHRLTEYLSRIRSRKEVVRKKPFGPQKHVLFASFHLRNRFNMPSRFIATEFVTKGCPRTAISDGG